MTFNLKLRPLALILLLLTIALPASADKPAGKRGDKGKWIEKMTEEQHKNLSEELKLTKEQQEAFFPVYDRMQADLRKAGCDSRRLDREVEKKGEAATDADYEKATDALNAFRSAEVRIQQQYYPQLKKLLSPRQLYKLGRAERDFRKKMMEKHHSLKGRKKKK